MRGDNDYPVTIASTFVNAEAFARTRTLQQGIPTIAGPDVSSGRVPLDRAAADYTPRSTTSIAATSTPGTSRSSGCCRSTSTVDVAYVGAKGVGGYAGLDINAPQTLGGGDARPSLRVARTPRRHQFVGRAAEDATTTRCRSRSTSAFTHGFLFKGAYTLSKAMNESDNDGRATLTVQHAERAVAATGRRRASTAGTTSSWASSTSCRGRATNGYGSIGKAIVSDWQLNGVFGAFSGNPFTMTPATARR